MITVNGDPMPHAAGMTVRAILEARRFIFPLLIVKVDGALVPRTDYDRFVVPDGAEVQVIHLMSGG